MRLPVALLALASLHCHSGDAFSISRPPHQQTCTAPALRPGRTAATSTSAASTDTVASTTQSPSRQAKLAGTVAKLRQVLAKEYITFFSPMVSSWYKPDVSFDDPLTSLSGVEAYRSNVDMLAGRTALGRALFEGAGINLHAVTGGEITDSGDGDVDIADIVTRWTLRFTFKALPWKPEAVFSGVSVYGVRPGGSEGVEIVTQNDFWDSIDIQEGADPAVPQAQYRRAPKTAALQDFLGQLKPEGLVAKAAGPELPFVLLRRGDGYDLRRYPGFVGMETPYERRDYGFGHLGAFGKGLDPLAPSLMKVYNDNDAAVFKDKTMTWPLRYASPGEGSDAPPPPPAALEKLGDGSSGQWRTVSLTSRPERVVAVRTFDDAAMGPVVRNCDRELRLLLARDGLRPKGGSEDFVFFAQYDAVHSMGTRRLEVWIELEEGGHPF